MPNTPHTTPKWEIPLIATGQADKETRHNLAMQRMDAMSNLIIRSVTTTSAPISAGSGMYDGAVYAIAGTGGAWSAYTTGNLVFYDGGWQEVYDLWHGLEGYCSDDVAHKRFWYSRQEWHTWPGALERTEINVSAFTASSRTHTYLGVTKTSTAPVVINLASGITNVEMTIHDEAKGAGTNNIRVVAASTETIDGAASIVLNVSGQSRTIFFGGGAWHIIGGYL